MIERLRGTIIAKQAPEVIIDVGGVGYEVRVPMTTIYQLPGVGEECILLTHFVVREDAQQLFGFVREIDRRLFRDLIKVNGVGPKLALAILSGMDTEQFAACLNRNDVDALVALPGVGKKTGERLLGLLVAVLGRLLVKLRRPRQVLLDAIAVLVQLAEVALRTHAPLLGAQLPV